MKPTGVVKRAILPTRINDYLIQELEIDLRHVNYGLKRDKNYRSKARSHFSIDDIVSFFESLDRVEAIPEKDGAWEYFIFDKVFFGQNRRYRIVFCVKQHQTHKAGVITLFQIKRNTR